MTAELLARAFADDPMMRYVIGREPDRHGRLTAIFRTAVRAGVLHGGVAQVHDGSELIATAVWLPTERIPASFVTMLRSGMLWVPFSAGISCMARMQRHEGPLERRLHRRFQEATGYLWCVGVEPSATGRGAGRKVIELACDQMTSRGLDRCILKTENEANVALYEHLGFRTFETISDPQADLRSWVMMRPHLPSARTCKKTTVRPAP